MKRISLLFVALAAITGPVFAGSISGTASCGGDCENFVIYLEGGPTQSTSSTEAVFNQKNRVFLPHVLPVLKGTTVNITNGDPFLHNVHIYRGKETVLNLALPFEGQVMQQTFDDVGIYTVLCDAHPEMSAHIVVLETPYFATTSTDGAYEISGVAPGTYTLVEHNLKANTVTRSEVQIN